jgi:hypothetical protein
MQGRGWIGGTLMAVVGTLLLVQVAFGANQEQVSRAEVTPVGKGSAARPLPVVVRFGLRVRSDDADKRPAAVTTYVIGSEGVVAFPRAFPSCSLSQAKRRRGPSGACKTAKVGQGVIRAAAGLEDDDTIAQSVPCNLQLRVYNTGAGVALRLDADPPIPPSFKSRRDGCPVPVHTAIRGVFKQTSIGGMVAMDLSFTLPDLLLHPLEDWEGALQLVDATLGGHTAQTRIHGKARSVGFFSAVGCHGGQRTTRAAFINAKGERSEATRNVRC